MKTVKITKPSAKSKSKKSKPEDEELKKKAPADEEESDTGKDDEPEDEEADGESESDETPTAEEEEEEQLLKELNGGSKKSKDKDSKSGKRVKLGRHKDGFVKITMLKSIAAPRIGNDNIGEITGSTKLQQGQTYLVPENAAKHLKDKKAAIINGADE